MERLSVCAESVILGVVALSVGRGYVVDVSQALSRVGEVQGGAVTKLGSRAGFFAQITDTLLQIAGKTNFRGGPVTHPGQIFAPP